MKNSNMKDLLKRMITAGIITSMMITPTAAFAATTDDVPEAPEAPVVESYKDNAKIEEYNRKVDEYNASAESYNKAVDEEYDAAVEETNRRNEEIALHNEAEEQRVSEAMERNEQAAKDAEERNRQIDEENAAGLKAAEEERDAQYESDLNKYNEDLEQYKTDYAQYEYDLAMEQKIKNAGYASVEDYNSRINSYYNEPASRSVEKNANAPELGVTDTYSIQEAEEKSGRMIKVTIRHNFYDTDLSYTEEFEIDANDIITFMPLSARAETTNPGYAAFYYNTDEAHSMGYWMESDSYVGTNANYHESGWNCGDTHEISFRDGTVRANDIEDIEVEYNYMWMPLRTYKTYNVPTEPGAPSEPVKGEVNFENTPYVEAQLEDIVDADILDFIESPVKKAYLDMMSYMDLFDVPQLPTEDPITTETTGTTDTGDSAKPTDSVTPSVTPTTPVIGTFTGSENGEMISEETVVPEAETESISDGSVAMAGADGAWALINLIAAIATVLIAAVAAILGLKKKDEDENEKTNRKVLVRGLGVITAIVSVIAFILTEDMSLPMQLTDGWTMMMVIILAVEAVFAMASKKKTSEDDEPEEGTFEAELA